ncbi:MAG: hypothetical protein OEU26_00800 [Candidatus Tectomicrobia bacterium]|nr:hypothetical protein [Candidatus Tectomicrobia bacterium]
MTIGRSIRWPVLLGLALIFVLGVGRNVQARGVEAKTFFQRCPGTITVKKTTQISGIISIPGSCTIHVVDGAILRFMDLDLKVQGDLLIEGDADRLAIRYSRIRADQSIDVSITGDVIIRNAKFASEDVSFDAAEVVRVARSNFSRVSGPIAIMGGARCEVRNTKPDDIGCTLDPTPECPCFDARGIVSELNAFLNSVPDGYLSECASPSIHATSTGAEELEIGSARFDHSVYVCSVVATQYALQELEPADELTLTDEELGACQLAVEYACGKLLR